MKQTPISEKLLVPGAAIIPARVVQPGGSIDEGVQQAPVAVDCDTRLKKIYVYTDNVFTPQSLTDSRIVRVQTDAFDLTGYIDFTHARQQDQFQVEIHVWMAHAAGVLLQRSAFQGGTLAMMNQLAPYNANYISGNHIEILIHQVYSLDNFATKVPLAYQFIVESR
ncbi:MAG TPA: hypothetical protein VN224_12820 [Xanthomonadales bacterium]|nr:hypothetical protein [Xanthomonadales bacterium]